MGDVFSRNPEPLTMPATTIAPRLIWRRHADHAPKAPGAYALLITLPRSTDLPPRFGGTLKKGRYIYLGSAHNAGGLKARIARHLLPTKKKHWHVDWLTTQASSIRFIAIEGADECDLADRLRAAGFQTPVSGFGSSDCQRCPSHLIGLPGGGRLGGIADLLVTSHDF